MSSTWFEKLFGFKEVSPEYVRAKIALKGDRVTSRVNGRSFQCGLLEISTLEELRKQSSPQDLSVKFSLQEIIGDVQKLHCDPKNQNALFQAASQFNLLEMAGPHVNPEKGIGIYENDFTQGPACAIACGAGTVYRNYFVPLNGGTGQTSVDQIDCLDLIGEDLKNGTSNLWDMTNGYALASQEGLLAINGRINNLSREEWESLKGRLKIGVQWNTEVTLKDSKQLVSQAYCSALPVAYSNVDSIYWESFARLILEAAYEATLHCALINLKRTGCNKVFLTLLGGGAFGNEIYWILESLEIAISKFSHTPLEIGIVSFGSSNLHVSTLIDKIA